MRSRYSEYMTRPIKYGPDGVTKPFRQLVNYKCIHRKLAEKKGVLMEFLMAKTLTQARKILFGSSSQ